MGIGGCAGSRNDGRPVVHHHRVCDSTNVQYSTRPCAYGRQRHAKDELAHLILRHHLSPTARSEYQVSTFPFSLFSCRRSLVWKSETVV